MSVIVQLADAVAASLNTADFSQEFNAQRLHQPSFDLAELATLHVSVVPRSQTITNAARQSSYFDCAIDIGIQQRLQPTEPSHEQGQIDALLDLAQEIADHLRHKRLDDYPDAAWLSIEHDPVVASEHLDQNRQFTSVLTATYRVKR